MAYPDGLTENNILDAFSQYQRTLFSSGQPFDRWCNGHTNALDAVQIKGFDLFRQRKCTDCHYGPALGTLKVVGGKKVPGLRGLSRRHAYLPDARVDLGAVLTLMPGGDFEAEDRRALTAFLKSL
jgi:cytochrome c peroxidase